MVVVKLGVVNTLPEETAVPPVAAVYHLLIKPVGTVVLKVTVPGPHLVTSATTGVAGNGYRLTFLVTLSLQPELEVTTNLTLNSPTAL